MIHSLIGITNTKVKQVFCAWNPNSMDHHWYAPFMGTNTYKYENSRTKDDVENL